MSQNDTITTLLVKQVSIPKGSNVIRLPGPRPSAVATPFLKPVLNWSTPAAVGQRLLPPDEAIVIVTNDPLCCMIFTNKNPAAANYQYVWSWGTGAGSTITVAPGQTPDLQDDLAWSVFSAGTPFHGPRLYPRIYKGKKWMWCDCSDTLSALNAIIISTGAVGMAATDAITLTIYRLAEGDETQVFSQHIGLAVPPLSQVLAFALLVADYYRVEITGDDDNTTAVLEFTVQHIASSEIMCHLALPDLTERQSNLVQAIRVLGAASHCMNLVSEQNATGSWVGDQPAQGIIWTTYLRGAAGSNGFQRLTGQQGNDIMELKKFNPYTFVTPEDAQDWEYTIPFTFSSSGLVTNTLHREMTSFHYTITYLKSGGTVAGADLSRNIQMEFFFALEYTTDGLWPMLGTSPASEDDKAAAVKVLASLENITHNPGFKEIMQTIGKYVRLAPPVLAMLGPYGKAGALIATGVGEIMRRKGYRTRKTARPTGQEGDEEGQHKTPRLAPEPGVPDVMCD